MAFSSALTLTDLNDYITPSQACIKPVEVEVVADEPATAKAATQIDVDSMGNYYEVPTKDARRLFPKKLQTAQISLNDCLACSGCITSAESVLITMQSHEEVLSFLSNNPPPRSSAHRVPVLSISPQSLASLAASVSSTSSQQMSMRAVLRRVQTFCRQALGFSYIFDTTFARHLALLEQCREFYELREMSPSDKLPMLTSACPGWICYAEKTHAEMLPFISKTKSPQQIMGSLVKEWMAKAWDRTPTEVYHVTVMPCYDKKLEASRQDFYDDVHKCRHVDCVITTGELNLLMQKKGWDLSAKVPGEDETDLGNIICGIPFPELVFHDGSSSGSYLHSIISSISTAPENRERDLELKSKIIRSSDYEEFVLEDAGTGEVVFKGAKCYGFRNLQNVVRKIGKESGLRGLPEGAVRGHARKKAAEPQGKSYDFIEVMACPSGCVNGGGQIRPQTKKVLEEMRLDLEGYSHQVDGLTKTDKDVNDPLIALPSEKWGNKDWIKQVEASYWTLAEEVDSTIRVAVLQILRDMCLPIETKTLAEDNNGSNIWMQKLDPEAELRRSRFFRTSYRKVETEVAGLAVKW